MFLERISPVKQLGRNVASWSARFGSQFDEFPIEEFPAGAFAVVLATLGGLLVGQVGASVSSLLQLDSPSLLGASVVLGIVLGVGGAIKLMFWLNDQTRNHPHQKYD